MTEGWAHSKAAPLQRHAAISRQQQSLEKLIEWELQPDKKLTELSKTGAHIVKTHLVHNRLHFEDIMSKQCDALFPVV